MLPATLMILLAVMLGLQLTLVRSEDRVGEESAGVAFVRPSASPQVAMLRAAPAIRQRPIFAPARAGNSDNSVDPLGGAQVSGAWAEGTKINLVLRQPDGSSRTLHVGQSVNDWILASVDAAGARFSNAGKLINIPFGGSAPTGTATEASHKKEEGQ